MEPQPSIPWAARVRCLPRIFLHRLFTEVVTSPYFYTRLSGRKVCICPYLRRYEQPCFSDKRKNAVAFPRWGHLRTLSKWMAWGQPSLLFFTAPTWKTCRRLWSIFRSVSLKQTGPCHWLPNKTHLKSLIFLLSSRFFACSFLINKVFARRAGEKKFFC